MKSYFKKITRLYFQEKEGQKIRPISNMDAQIISELLESLAKIGSVDLKNLVSQWKQSPDEDVLDQLIDYNVNKLTTGVVTNEEGESSKNKWIDLGGTSIQVKDILSFEKDKYYDVDRAKVVYCIVLNRCSEGHKIPLHANKQIEFLLSDKRDECYDSIKMRLIQFNNIRFL